RLVDVRGDFARDAVRAVWARRWAARRWPRRRSRRREDDGPQAQGAPDVHAGRVRWRHGGNGRGRAEPRRQTLGENGPGLAPRSPFQFIAAPIAIGGSGWTS